MRIVWPLLIAFALISCEKQKDPLVVHWNNGKAVSVSIKRTLLTSDTLPDVRVHGSEYNIVGTAYTESDIIRFTPDIPFERGQTYDVFSDQRKVHSFSIPFDNTTTAPEILASYPSCDTVPENLLKIYLVFDQPMMEGRAYNFIHLINQSTGDTIDGAFLDLQPELWSGDEKMLTLWLDPGRIKKDLIPNKTMGSVLTPNTHYELHVSPGWKSKSGHPMSTVYRREFVTTVRDSGKPDVTTWNVVVGDEILVDMKESLDQPLLSSSISVWSGENEIAGSLQIQKCEKTFQFTPEKALAPGTYRIEIESRLEDLAGNNLNRLFETDVTEPKSVAENKSVHTIEFKVR